MKQLIELQIIPAQIELRKTEAKIEYTNAKPSHTINRQKGGLEVQTKAVKVNTDTYACRSSMGPGFMSVGDNIKEYANKGVSDAYGATAKYASRGQQLNKTKRGEELITQFAKQDTYKNVKMNVGLDFVPRVAPTVTVEPGDIKIDFKKDELQIEWNMQEHELHFTPGTIEVEMVQRPDVIVRYIGEPNYVPKSSATG